METQTQAETRSQTTDALVRLIRVKSIVTLLLAAVFCILALKGAISGEQFMTIFNTVTAFYFGTQTERERERRSDHDGNSTGN
ncbi:MAG: hypothetical protein K6B74_02955 [Ruminococcus sp.]|nr:hypothetical protein [Ruminococcus sp.]